KADERVEHAHGDWNAERVVAEGANEVLTYVTHRRAADLYRSHHSHEAALDQRNVARLDRNVGPGADREANVGLCERGRVVDAVTHHSDGLTFELKFLHLVRLVVGQHLGKYTFDADLARNGAPRALIVAGQHDYFDAKRLQCVNRGFRIWLDRVGD